MLVCNIDTRKTSFKKLYLYKPIFFVIWKEVTNALTKELYNLDLISRKILYSNKWQSLEKNLIEIIDFLILSIKYLCQGILIDFMVFDWKYIST